VTREPQEGLVPSQGTPPNVTVIQNPRSITMHNVADHELDVIMGSSGGVHLTFFGICFGALLTSAATLLTVTITGDRVFAGFVAAALVSLILSFYFGIKAISDYRSASKKVESIKGR